MEYIKQCVHFCFFGLILTSINVTASPLTHNIEYSRNGVKFIANMSQAEFDQLQPSLIDLSEYYPTIKSLYLPLNLKMPESLSISISLRHDNGNGSGDFISGIRLGLASLLNSKEELPIKKALFAHEFGHKIFNENITTFDSIDIIPYEEFFADTAAVLTTKRPDANCWFDGLKNNPDHRRDFSDAGTDLDLTTPANVFLNTEGYFTEDHFYSKGSHEIYLQSHRAFHKTRRIIWDKFLEYGASEVAAQKIITIVLDAIQEEFYRLSNYPDKNIKFSRIAGATTFSAYKITHDGLFNAVKKKLSDLQ